MSTPRQDATAAFEAAFEADNGLPHYVLRLFVAGTRSRSVRAVANITRICEEHLAGRYELIVVDLYQQPALARENQIVAAPTLVKLEPSPMRKIVGDFSDEGRVLAGLEIPG